MKLLILFPAGRLRFKITRNFPFFFGHTPSELATKFSKGRLFEGTNEPLDQETLDKLLHFESSTLYDRKDYGRRGNGKTGHNSAAAKKVFSFWDRPTCKTDQSTSKEGLPRKG